MRNIKFGKSGLEVSPICIGCMGFGDPAIGYPTWSIREEESRSVIKYAIEAGINFFDTAICILKGLARKSPAGRSRISLNAKISS